jgi:hypothetical protein
VSKANRHIGCSGLVLSHLILLSCKLIGDSKRPRICLNVNSVAIVVENYFWTFNFGFLKREVFFIVVFIEVDSFVSRLKLWLVDKRTEFQSSGLGFDIGAFSRVSFQMGFKSRHHFGVLISLLFHASVCIESSLSRVNAVDNLV